MPESNMRAKYESLTLTVLKDLCKARKIKGISRLDKAGLVDAMMKQDEIDSAAKSKSTETFNDLNTDKEKDKEKDKVSKVEKKTPSRNVRKSSTRTIKKSQPESNVNSEEKIEEKTPETLETSENALTKNAVAKLIKSEVSADKSAEASADKAVEVSDDKSSEPSEEKKRPVRKAATRVTKKTADKPSEEKTDADTEKSEDRRSVTRNNRTPNRRGSSDSEQDNKKTTNRNYHKKSQRTDEVSEKSESKKIDNQDSKNIQKGQSNKSQQNNQNSQNNQNKKSDSDISQFKDLSEAVGILEVLSEGYGFIRSDNYMPGENDVYVSPSQIRKFSLRTGDFIKGKTRKNNQNDRYGALMFIESINGYKPEDAYKRKHFEDMTPIFPDERVKLEMTGSSIAMRLVDLFSPIGKGQRGMIVSQPKAGKTTLLKEVAKSVKHSYQDMHIIVLLIDERPEEVTDMKESISGGNVEVIYSTFDELPEHHKRVSEMVIERAKRLVEHGQDVMILLDSITRLARAYNLTVPPSGRTLSGGLDPAALHMPKRFFGAARNIREGGSLTILATALVDTGSKMDDVVYEEFKGTGNMELILDRKLSEKRVFPALDLAKSGTRRDDLLLTPEEQDAMNIIHKGLNGMRRDEATENILHMITHTRTNADFIRMVLRRRIL